MFELDRTRRDHHDLCGELTVRCDVAGAAKTPGGSLLTGDFNLSSVRARAERAKVWASRARTGTDIDWMAALEEFCERVFEAERLGTPGIRLDEHPLVVRDTGLDLVVDGFRVLMHHPVILFGDGGTAKSYLSLYLAGRLAQRGLRVLYADWELLPDEHLERLERLFGTQKPPVWYVTCDRPLEHDGVFSGGPRLGRRVPPSRAHEPQRAGRQKTVRIVLLAQLGARHMVLSAIGRDPGRSGHDWALPPQGEPRADPARDWVHVRL